MDVSGRLEKNAIADEDATVEIVSGDDGLSRHWK